MSSDPASVPVLEDYRAPDSSHTLPPSGGRLPGGPMRLASSSVVAASLAAVLLLAGCKSDPQPAPAPTPPPATSRLHRFAYKADAPSNRETGAPLGEDAELTTPEGQTVHISDRRGKPVVLVFNRGFAGVICPYCTTYTAQLADRYDEIKALGAEVLLVYPTKDADQAKVAEFKAAVEDILKEEGEGGLPFPVYLDRGLVATTRFNLTGDLTKPSTFVLDAQGIVRYAYVGNAPDERPAIERIIEELRKLRG
jgi:peroxiredoxin